MQITGLSNVSQCEGNHECKIINTYKEADISL